MTIPLIDKQDNFEIVDAQIAAILASETLAQQALATAAGKDSDLWKFDVYSEVMFPWSQFQNDKEPTPIVNVWYDRSNFNESQGDVVRRQMDSATFNIDIYAADPARDNPDGGYYPADQTTVATLHRIARLIRNILMHPDNVHLQLKQVVDTKSQNLVGKRWINSKEIFQPQIGDRPVPGMIAMRIVLSATFNEFPVYPEYQNLEIVHIEYSLDGFGQVKVNEAQYDTT